MFTIHLKSSDGQTLVKVTNKEKMPTLDRWYAEHGYTSITQEEFQKIRTRLRRMRKVTTGFTNNEDQLKENLVHLQAQRAGKSNHKICGREVTITDMKNGRFVYETDRGESGYVTEKNLSTAIYKIAEGLN